MNETMVTCERPEVVLVQFPIDLKRWLGAVAHVAVATVCWSS
jgi:hypothetical protein